MGNKIIVFIAVGVAALVTMLYWVWTNIGPESAMFAAGGLLGSFASTLFVMKMMSVGTYYVSSPRVGDSVEIINPNERRITR